MSKAAEYCRCKDHSSITSGCEDDFGYWDICTKCGKKIEGGHHFYNHYDGKDHEEFWLPNGDVYVDGEDDD